MIWHHCWFKCCLFLIRRLHFYSTRHSSHFSEMNKSWASINIINLHGDPVSMPFLLAKPFVSWRKDDWMEAISLFRAIRKWLKFNKARARLDGFYDSFESSIMRNRAGNLMMKNWRIDNSWHRDGEKKAADPKKYVQLSISRLLLFFVLWFSWKYLKFQYQSRVFRLDFFPFINQEEI